MDSYQKIFDSIVNSIYKIIRRNRTETKNNFDKIDVALLISDMESELKKLKKLYERWID